MFCPRCGQERISEETSFCSRCGFLLTALPALLETGGMQAMESPTDKGRSPRSRGIRQGLFIFLLTFVIAPIVGLISQFGLGIEPWPVGVVVFGMGFGGLLRIAYALMFESGNALLDAPRKASPKGSPALDRPKVIQALNPQDANTHFDNRLGGTWLDTNDLRPPSVTDNTTKLLERDQDKATRIRESP